MNADDHLRVSNQHKTSNCCDLGAIRLCNSSSCVVDNLRQLNLSPTQVHQGHVTFYITLYLSTKTWPIKLKRKPN